VTAESARRATMYINTRKIFWMRDEHQKKRERDIRNTQFVHIMILITTNSLDTSGVYWPLVIPIENKARTGHTLIRRARSHAGKTKTHTEFERKQSERPSYFSRYTLVASTLSNSLSKDPVPRTTISMQTQIFHLQGNAIDT
jgi:hypothetical protein